MHRWKFIPVAVLAILAATFTIELPFTQVNYIHHLVKKKERSVTSMPKDSHRLHKTYYEPPDELFLTSFARLAPPFIISLARPLSIFLCHPPVSRTDHPNILRGPPNLT